MVKRVGKWVSAFVCALTSFVQAASVDSALVVSKFMLNPSRTGGGYVEVRNTSARETLSLADVRLDGAVSFAFPAGTQLAPGACLAIAADAATFAALYPAAPAPVGVYTGTLGAAGELRLVRAPRDSELADVEVDRLAWSAARGWPTPGVGQPLVLIHPDEDNASPANWMVLDADTAVQKTLVDWGATWRYLRAAADTGWQNGDFDDSSWASGAGPLGKDSSDQSGWAHPLATSFKLVSGRRTYYFRTTFTNDGTTPFSSLALQYTVDDAAVYYLNGTEIQRSALCPEGDIADDTLATSAVDPEGAVYGPVTIAASALKTGVNTLAVEVHQNGDSSSDIVTGTYLAGVYKPGVTPQPGVATAADGFRPSIPAVRIARVGADSVVLRNGGTSETSLVGWTLGGTKLSGKLAAGATKTVELAPPKGWLQLKTTVNGETLVVDCVASPEKEVPRVVINEVASQNALFVNPASGEMDDWFEIANTLQTAVDLSGWVVTDTLAADDPPAPAARASKAFTFPNGLVLEPGEHLRVWTGGDVTNETAEATGRANLQAPFGLGKRADGIYLFDADQRLVDQVTWGAEVAPTNTLGRWPDLTGDFVVLPVPTPATANRPPRFTTPLIATPAPVVLAPNAGTTVAMSGPANATWKLLSADGTTSVPSGFSVNAANGRLTWSGGATGYYAAAVGAYVNGALVDALVYGVSVRANDTAKPSLASSAFREDNGEIYLVFSEQLGAAAFDSATWTAAGLAVAAVRPIANGTGVALTLAEPLAAGVQTTVTARVPDLAGNTLALSVTLMAPTRLPLPDRAVRGVREPSGPGSRRNPVVVTEIAASPAARVDGRDLRFLEIYNSAPYPQRVGGYVLSGGLSYTFPKGEKIPANSYVVLAPSPADVAAVYGLADVRAAVDNGFSLTRKIELRDEIGAQLAEIEPSDKWPWPAGAEGTGHTLVLARPSYGQADAKAWSRSTKLGGSPGAADPTPGDAYATIVVNEYRAHAATADGFIELFNVGGEAVDLSGCTLSLSNGSSGYVIPAGTTLAGHGYAVFSESQLGFRLCGTSVDVMLRTPVGAGQTVIDAFRVPNVELERSFGRTPDGGTLTARLARSTPGARNALREVPPVVLNEIMYNPLSGKSDEEYVELLNLTDEAIDLDGWSLSGGIDHTFTTVIAAKGFRVAAAKRSAFKALYPKQTGVLDDGAYSGTLSDHSDTVRLRRPMLVWDAETDAPVQKNVILEEVTYCDSARWGQWADGGGSSLERVDPQADPRLATSWADSDESDKCDWTTVSFTGPLEYGRTIGQDPESDTFGNPLRVDLGLYGAGECLVDDVVVAMEGGENYVLNASFEDENTTWTWVGTHQDSRIETRSDAASGAKALHLRACGRLHTGGNGIRGLFREQMPTNGRATVSMRMKWLAGSPDAHLRVRGNWIEADGSINTTFAFGTPGKKNSRAQETAAPDVAETFHLPAMPQEGENVYVWARVAASEGLASVNLEWAEDDSLTTNRVAMTAAEGGWYRGVIKGSFASGSLVAYHVVATAASEHASTTVYPAARDNLVRWGEETIDKAFGTYRVWITQRAIRTWRAHNKDNNKKNPFTFVYGNGERIIQDAGIIYGGSPLHMQGYSKPFNGDTDYIMEFAKDDLLLGDDGAILCTAYDSTYVMEQWNYSLFRKLGLPGMHRRFVRLYANGKLQTSKGVIEDTEKPGGDMLKHWHPDDKTGQLMKINEWYEYNIDTYDKFSKSYDFGTGLRPGGTLEPFTTTTDDGETVYKKSRYRWHWQRRSYKNFEPSDYTEFWKLIDVLNTPGASLAAVREVVDLDAFLGVPVINHFVGNWDTYGYQRGKNMYMYKSDHGWGLVGWDMDIGLDDSGHVSVTIDPLRISVNDLRDPTYRAFIHRPDIARWWWRKAIKLIEATDPESDECQEALAKNQALVADGLTPSCFTNRYANLVARGAHVQNQRLAVDAAAFELTSPRPNETTTVASNVCTLEGVAPFLVTDLTLNGSPLAVTWTTPTKWSAQVSLTAAKTPLTIVAFGEDGAELGRATAEIVTEASLEEPADGTIVISEIMWNPARTGGAYIELRNLSPETTRDLGGWTFRGAIDLELPTGTMLAPNACLVVAQNPSVFKELYGWRVTPVACFAEALPSAGELLLYRPARGAELVDPLVDRVAWGGPGWPEAGVGEPLVLSNPTSDNDIPANWRTLPDAPQAEMPAVSLLAMDAVWKYWKTAEPGAGWMNPDFDDSAWGKGPGPVGHDSGSGGWPYPIRTDFSLTKNLVTYYYRTTFTNSVPVESARLLLSYVVDDAAIIYLNGEELTRTALMSTGMVDPETLALSARDPEGVVEGPYVFETPLLREGENVLAVEVHQSDAGSTDIAWGAILDVTNLVLHAGTPGTADTFGDATKLPAVKLNEASAGQVELYNAGTTTVSLVGWSLNGPSTRLTLSGRLSPGAYKTVAFTRPDGDLRLVWKTRVIDVLPCAGLASGEVFGRFPDGADTLRLLAPETPGAPNRVDPTGPVVVINEFMSQNGLFVNPLSDAMDDWFELVNAGTEAADLSGWIVTDTLATEEPPTPVTKASKAYTFPAGLTLAPGEVLRVWTGSDVALTAPFDRANIQAPFGLGKSADAIYLFDAEQKLVDAIVYNETIPKTQSYGRWPHATGAWMKLPVPTPGVPNRPPRFAEARLGTPAVVALDEGDAQTLTNSLAGATWVLVPTEAGRTVPAGLSVDAQTGTVTCSGETAGTVSAVLCAFKDGECIDAVTLVVSVSPAGELVISTCETTATGLSFGWTAKPGATYAVETAPTLTGPWTEVEGTRGEAGQVTVPIAPTVPSAFFRVKRVQ